METAGGQPGPPTVPFVRPVRAQEGPGPSRLATKRGSRRKRAQSAREGRSHQGPRGPEPGADCPTAGPRGSTAPRPVPPTCLFSWGHLPLLPSCVKLYTCPACSFGSSSGTPCCSPLGQGLPQSGVPKPSPGRSPLGAHGSLSRPSSRGPASPEDRALCHPVTSPHLDWAPAPEGHQAVLADSTRAASG